ncbi:hypothetical protein BDR05DRAFT_977831 [Suillus weaverae]|nr:hypothetical protein BDR05DRAFT_977831 [Suillus weaverae]
MSRQPIREAWTDECLFHERLIALGLAIEPSTSSAYDSHLNSYINFCQLHHRIIDPTQDTLSYYVVWLSHFIEPRSVDNYLSGIANRLKFMFPDILDDVARIVDTIGSHPSYDDSLFLATLITGFKSLQRLGELVWPDSTKLQTYRKVSLRHTLHSTATSASYLLPYQKNDSGATALAGAGMAPDLIRAAGRWSSDEFNKYIRQHPFLLHALMHGTARAP